MGFTFIELITFAKQIGLAVAGASAFWGLIFMVTARRPKHRDKELILEWVAERMLIPFFAGLLLCLFALIFAEFFHPAYAHEGISILPTIPEISKAISITSPVIIILSLFSVLGLLVRLINKGFFHRCLIPFFLIQLFLIIFAISLPGITDKGPDVQAFFIGHGFHSIFTFGTVLVLDFLFLSSKGKPIVQQNIFPFFPTISKLIWVGLGIDFLSVALVFNEALQLTPKFFFVQTVIAILIINGTLLSGPVTRKLLHCSTISQGGEKLTKKWAMVSDITGAISISSWSSVYFLDFFAGLTLSYHHFLIGYIALIMIIFWGHFIWEKFDRGKPMFETA